MKQKNIKFLIFITLILVEATSIFLMYKSSNNKDTILDNVKLKNDVIKENSGIAIMLQNSDGSGYTESTSSSFPTSGYKFKSSKSGCIDSKGQAIEGALTFTNGVASVKTKSQSYCYLYFDIETIEDCNDTLSNCVITYADDLWNSTLEDDGYRYIGTNPNNYVCFGYTNKDTDCDFTNTTNSDLYAYRIIGIFEDSSGNQYTKLIKKEALNTNYAWNADYSNDIAWSGSDVYKGINGSYFLNNTTYSYMQNSTWLSKIADWKYTATNTKTYESSGPNYYNSVTVQNIYLHEMNRSGKSSTVGVWDTVQNKIGLMYVSDYTLSLGSSALSYTTYTNRTTLKTGWMHISNNDSGAPSSYEWTMSRCGVYDGYFVWYVTSDGYVNARGVDGKGPVRPVFYLTSDAAYLDGTGAYDDPFIILDDSEIGPTVYATANNNNSTSVTMTITTNEAGTYCVNTSSTASNMSSCTFSGSITTSGLTTGKFTTNGTYYAHVMDSAGNYGISSPLSIVTCFTEETLVSYWYRKKKKKLKKKIKEIEIGDIVYSYDSRKGCLITSKVKAVHINKANKLFKLTFDDGNYVEVSENHPFYVKDVGYMNSQILKAGYEILCADCDTRKIINVEEIFLDEYVDLYVLELESGANFIVGLSGVIAAAIYTNVYLYIIKPDNVSAWGHF